MSSEPTLDELVEKLTEEERVYQELLARLDSLSSIAALYDAEPSLPELLEALNASSGLEVPEAPPSGSGLKGWLRGIARRLLEPELASLRAGHERQRAFSSDLIRFLNVLSGSANRASATQAELASALVGFSQRIDRLADAKDRVYASLGNTRADLLLAGMEQKLDAARLELRRLRDELEGLESETALARAELRGLAGRVSGEAPPAPAATTSFEAEHYVAFEDRFRGESSAIRERLEHYVSVFTEGPVLDLGCGRGEFLEALAAAGVEARGVDGNPDMIRVCQEKGLSAETADVFRFLEACDESSAGGVFSAQVIEHLPPPSIARFLDLAHRAVRPGGKIVIETVNPASVSGLVGFYRDPTHHKPIHPTTLDFLLRAAGFRDVALEYLSPVEERARLLRVPDGAPGSAALNQNVDRLNDFLFGELDYAAIGVK